MCYIILSMARKQVFCFFLFNTAVLPSFSMVNPEPLPIFKEITQLYRAVSGTLKQEELTPVIIGGDGLYSADIINDFVENTSPIPVIISNDNEIKTIAKFIDRQNSIFVFADYVDVIEKLLLKSNTYTYWNVRSFMQFIVCFPVTDVSWVEQIVKLIWKNNILNFLLVYYYERLEMVTYNPFEDKIINIADVSENEAKSYFFTNKLHNMNGYQLQVSFFADPPRIVEKNGEFYGMDYMILKGFVQRVNATVKLITPPENTIAERYHRHYIDIVRGNVDFGFVGCFAFTEAPKDVATTYPRRVDDVVVLVPFASAMPQFYYIFMVFGKTVWLFTFGSFVTALLYNVIVLRYLSNECKSALELLLKAYNLLMFGTSNYRFASLKILFLFWIFVCAVLNTLFCSLLTSGLVTPKFGQNIETLDELKANNVTISLNSFSAQGVKGQYPKHLLKEETADDIMERLRRQSTDSAYAIPMSVAELITAKAFRDDGRPVYHIIKEHLIPSQLIYVFPLNSPYLDEANKYLLLDQQFGLSRATYENYASINKTYRGRHAKSTTVLTLKHLQTAYIVLIVGLLASSLTFILEVIVYRAAANKSKIIPFTH